MGMQKTIWAACRICVKPLVRFHSTEKPSSTIGRKLERAKEIEEYFGTSTWSTKELLEREEDTEECVNREMLEKLYDLSGFTKRSLGENEESLKESLVNQLDFITKLKKVEVRESGDNITRLIDDKNTTVITFDSLMKAIDSTTQNLSKGEVENSWNPLSLSKLRENNFFVVKEGLHKDK